MFKRRERKAFEENEKLGLDGVELVLPLLVDRLRSVLHRVFEEEERQGSTMNVSPEANGMEAWQPCQLGRVGLDGSGDVWLTETAESSWNAELANLTLDRSQAAETGAEEDVLSDVSVS